MKLLRVAVGFLFLAGIAAGGAFAHSGGTDRCGGHTNRKTGVYHVHDQAKNRACQSDSKSSESAPSMSSAESDTTADEVVRVTRVVEGDTIVVLLGDREYTVRLIGVDTPETVHPNKPVEFFGKEASTFTRKRLEGRTVRLERDPTGDTRDKYGRLLRHVYVDDGTHFNALLISKGYAHAYTRFPFSQMEEFRELEREAREAGRGLWGDNPGTVATEDITETVYVTKTGKKYHLDGCSSLRSSKIPMELEAAAKSGYGPCGRCRPPSVGTATGTKPAPAVSNQCAATTQKGTRCKRKAKAGSSYCRQHGG